MTVCMTNWPGWSRSWEQRLPPARRSTWATRCSANCPRSGMSAPCCLWTRPRRCPGCRNFWGIRRQCSPGSWTGSPSCSPTGTGACKKRSPGATGRWGRSSPTTRRCLKTCLCTFPSGGNWFCGGRRSSGTRTFSGSMRRSRMRTHGIRTQEICAADPSAS